MALISYHVEAHNVSSYTTYLLQSLYEHQQSGDHTDIFLSSGDQTVSVPSILLANFSPFLSSLLQSACPCCQPNFIILPVTPSFTMHSLVALLYTGYISNMDKNQVEQLMVLTKEMGIKISKNIINGPSSSSQSDTEEVQILSMSGGDAAAAGDYCRSTSIASNFLQCDYGGDRYSECSIRGGHSGDKYNSSSDSYTNTVTRLTQVRKKRIRFSDVMDSDSDFVEMCPPVCTRTPGQIFEEPADNIEQEGIEDIALHQGIEENSSRREILEEISLQDIFEENGKNYELVGGEQMMPNRNSLYDGDELEEEMQAMAGELFYEGSEFGGQIADRIYEYGNEVIQDCHLENNNQLSSLIFCKICDQIFEEERDFTAHLASTHFQARLDEEFGKFKKGCPFCLKQSKDVGRNMKHIGDYHSKVYEYYDEKFGVGSRSMSKLKNTSEFQVFDPSSACFKASVQANQIQQVDHPISIKSSLRGILKCSNSKVDEKHLKGILRSSTLKQPSPCRSILKKQKSTSKQMQKYPIVIAEVVEEAQPMQFLDVVVRNVALSMQDKVGEKIVDLK